MGKMAALAALSVFAALAASLFAAPGLMGGAEFKQGSDGGLGLGAALGAGSGSPGTGAGIGAGNGSGAGIGADGKGGMVGAGKAKSWADRLSAVKERVKNFGLNLKNRMGVAAGKGQYLDVRGEHLACRLDFTSSVVDDVISAVPGTSGALSGISSTLASDKEELASLSLGNDTAAFNSFVSGTLRQDMAEAVRLLSQERRGFRNYNASNETQAQLRNTYQVALQAMNGCEKGAVDSLGQSRTSHYDAVIKSWQDSVDKLAAKGIQTSAMQSVIDGAKSGVIAQLQNAEGSGDSGQVKNALRTYCIGNGCEGANGTAAMNYHGYAKMNLERLQAILNYAKQNGSSAQLDGAQAKLDSIRSKLEAAGGAKMGEGEYSAMWGYFNDSAKLIREHLRTRNMLHVSTGASGPAVPASSNQ